MANDFENAQTVDELKAELAAIDASLARIEFLVDGTIVHANENFLNAVGYSLEEIKGKHHRIFVDSAYAATREYENFWGALGQGKFDAGEYRRFGKGGREIWIQASYNPITAADGRVVKVVKYASDITAQKQQNADFQGQLEAIGKSQAVIEFNMDGTIIQANENFLAAVGYTLDEIRGRHHRIFVDGMTANSLEYRAFWQRLNEGVFDTGEYRRFGKGGKEIWIQASYNPIYDTNGKLFKVVKYCSDITAAKMQAADFGGQVQAIGKSQGVIEFEMDGTIRTANQNFLDVVGYSLEEIQGQHHRMFAEASLASSVEYRRFWEALNEGKYDSGEYKRIGKGGKEIWIQASYNPILDMNGKPFKVVKYCTDVTEQKLQAANYSGQIEAIQKSQAVIEFNMDGTILWANDNFLGAVGYSIDEIRGQHHRMFAEPSYGQSQEYANFWAKLNRGEYDTGEYQRFGKGGKEIWIQASYNPILDLNGTPYKVVKYATDVTEQKFAQLEIEQVCDAMAKGDLTRKMSGEFTGKFAEVQDALNKSLVTMGQMLREIGSTARTLSEETGMISQGNASLNDRTQEQAAALEETAAAMEEMSSTTRQNADNAKNAKELSETASSLANVGGEVVGEAIRAMDAINSSSKKISDIIGVIDEIAFQTNILALNAAVEAARAGEQGRGFAVVASEVRNLAQRSAGAAKEIKGLIQDSVEKVEEGAKLVNNSGDTLEQIVDSVNKVSELIADIATASVEQSSGVDGINQSVAKMDEMTQRNAALVEEAAATSTGMDQKSKRLAQLVANFHVE